MLDIGIISPAMLKLFSECSGKFYYRYIEQIPSPHLDKSFAAGKNIHALASYYLKGSDISKLEKVLTSKEAGCWEYLKCSKYFNYETVGVENNISFKLGDFWFGGRLDAVVKNNNSFYILDYKTGGTDDDMTYDYQTMVYLLACEGYYKEYDSLSFVYLDLKRYKEVKIDFSTSLKSQYISKLNDCAAKMINFDINKFSPDKKCMCEYSKICK